MSDLWAGGRVVDVHVCDPPLAARLVAPGGAAEVRGQSRGGGPALAVRLVELVEDMERAGVAASVVVLFEDVEEFLHLAPRYPGRLFGQLFYDSTRPQEELERIREIHERAVELTLGVVTAFPAFGQDPRRGEFGPLYEYCAENGLPVQFFLDAPPGREPCRPLALGVLARIYPLLTLIGLSSEGHWGDDLPDLVRQFPNLFLGVAGSLPGSDPGNDELSSFSRLVRTAGSGRLMFASYRAGRDATYLRRLKAARELPWRQRRDLLWRTAFKAYGPRLLTAGRVEPPSLMR